MDVLPIVLAFICLSGGVQCATEITIATDAPDQAMERGAVVKVTCVSTETPGLAVISLKAQTPGEPVTVVTNQVVEQPFRNSTNRARYTAHFNFDADTKKVTLDIVMDGMQPWDSGKFLCELQAGNTKLKSKIITLAIKTPVADVAMATILANNTVRKVPNDDTVHLSQGMAGGLACVVTLASYVITPVVNVTVNGAPSAVDFVGGAPMRADGEPQAMYQYAYRYVTSSPHYTLDGGVVLCSAFTPGYESEGDVKQAEVVANATYLPVILCDDLKPKSMEGAVGELNCTVWSNPKVSLLQVNFGLTILDRVLDFEEGTMTTGKYTLTRTDGAKNSTVSFLIDGMTTAFFDNYVYRIKAQSSLGIVHQSFKFERPPVSSSPRCTSSPWLLVTFTLTFLKVVWS